jgi:putative phosphoesterase
LRYGLLADVHANLAALEAAVAALRDDGAERFMCAGDIVGYGPQPNECIELLRGLDAVCVAGNHELIALGRLTEAGIHPWALETLQWTRGVLSPENRRWLEELPVRADTPEGITVAHGSLDDPRTYVRTEELAREQLARVGASRVVVLGHTHAQMTVTDGGKLLVNPGAVGQSRERRVRASAATLELDTGSVRFVSVPYDTRATRRALIHNSLPRGAYRLRPSPARRVWLRLPLGLRHAVKRLLGRGE